MEKDLDIKLYNEYLDGEKGAFELLYNKYKDKIQYFVYNIVSNLLGLGFAKEAVSLAISVGIGAITYGILVVVLKVDEINVITDVMKKKLNKVA